MEDAADVLVVDSQPERRGRDDQVIPAGAVTVAPQAGQRVPALVRPGLAGDLRQPPVTHVPQEAVPVLGLIGPRDVQDGGPGESTQRLQDPALSHVVIVSLGRDPELRFGP